MSTEKRKRKTITLAFKANILARLHNGEKLSSVAKHLNLNEATVRGIRLREKEIRDSVLSGTTASLNHINRNRPAILQKMEKMVVVWIQECMQHGIPLDSVKIRFRATEVYDTLLSSGEAPTKPPFTASKGWYERFRKRLPAHNAPEDCETPTQFPVIGESFEQIFIEEEDGPVPMKLSSLKEGLQIAQRLQTFFEANDPSVERSATFKAFLDNALAPYTELLNEGIQKRKKRSKR